MTLEKLKALLEAGTITQEVFDTLAADLEDVTQGAAPSPLDSGELQKLIQSQVDKALVQAGKDKAAMAKQLETLKKEKLTADERAELERKEKEAELLTREQALKDQENRLYAVKALKTAKLDDGSDAVLTLVDFVLGPDEETIDARVADFAKLLGSLVQSKVDQMIKANGYIPPKGSEGAGTVNPFAKDTLNLTEQGRLLRENPELAKQLRTQAGAKT